MNGAELMILGKLILTFGVLLGIPLWQLFSLRRERLRRAAGSAAVVAQRPQGVDVLR